MNNKRIIFQVTKTYMKKNKKRTAITFAGILVMVILMTAVFIGKDTVMEFMKNAVAADQGSWHCQVYDLDKSEVDEIKAISSVDKLEISKPLGYTEFPQSAKPDTTPYLEIKGYSGELFDWMNINVKEGRLPEKSNEILISERALKEGADVKIGDTLEVDTFDRYIHAFMDDEEKKAVDGGKEPGFVMFGSGFLVEHGTTAKAPDHFPYFTGNETFEEVRESTGFKGTFTIVGIMESPYYETEGQGGYMALTKIDNAVAADEKVNVVFTTDLNSKENFYEQVLLLLDSRRTDDERENLEKSGAGYITNAGNKIPVEEGRVVENDMLLTFASKGSDASFNFLMKMFQAFFIILITIAALVLIYNVFSMSFKERSRYLGMLSSVGATRRQKRWSVYYEVFSLLILALPIGIIFGLLVVKGAMALLYPHFSEIISKIATNVITGRSCEIGYKLIVSPVNLLFVIIFSVAAVWISAWLPAMRIAKVGPIESIRGNDTGIKAKKKGYKTGLKFMKKGQAERLLAGASIGRNRHSTRGIIRSITAFIALTLITAFAVRSFTDVIKSKTSDEEFTLGKAYQGFDYTFGIDNDDDYASGKNDIETSDEVSEYKELDIIYFAYNIALSDYTEEYRNTLEAIIRKYYPDGIPETVMELHLEPKYTESNPVVNMIALSNEDYDQLKKAAGISPVGNNAEMPEILVYDNLSLSTDEYKFAFEGAVKPGYSRYEINKPLNAKEGDTVNLLSNDYNEETEEFSEVQIPVTVAGYVGQEDVADYFTLNNKEIVIFVSEQTRDILFSQTSEESMSRIRERQVLFNVNTDDSNLVRRLTQIKNEFGDSALASAGMISGFTDFKNAILNIVQIVAVCFTLLIAIICMLNLYNSVMGRKLSRHQELTVLYSMGMTDKQKTKMLLMENGKLLFKSFIYSGVITAAFVVCLRMVLNSRFGRMEFTLPVWIIILTAIVSAAGLLLFTVLCYRENSRAVLIDRIRTETV